MDLKVGVVGFGLRAGLYRHAHHPGEGSVVTMVCDTSERGRADATQNLPEARITADLDELLNAGLDAVLVLTPDNQHAVVAKRTLEAGIPTFCEKPLDVTLTAVDEILETAFQTGTKLYVGHNMRHMPVVRQMRELIESGVIGEVKAVWCRHFVGNGGDYYFKDWHAERANTTSLLLQKGAHDIDSRRDNTDRRMRDWFSVDHWRPTEQTDLNPIIDVEDISMMQMKLDNGVLASYQQCHFTPDYWRNYTVIGTAGRLENFGDTAGGTIKVWNTRSKEGYVDADLEVKIAAAAGGHGGADPRLIAEFLRFAVSGGPTETSPVAARAAVAAGVLATESLRTDGSARNVPALRDEVLAYFAANQIHIV